MVVRRPDENGANAAKTDSNDGEYEELTLEQVNLMPLNQQAENNPGQYMELVQEEDYAVQPDGEAYETIHMYQNVN